MQPINDYRLATHTGAYEHWPLRTALLQADGRATGLQVPGYALLHQYRVGAETLLITDWDCPYEEATEVLLLAPSPRVIAHRRFFAPYASYWLRQVEAVNARRLRLIFAGDDTIDIMVRDALPWWSPLAWRSRLGVQPAA